MDKCTFCVQPYEQKDESGKVIEREPRPMCAIVCPTGSLLGGDAAKVAQELRERIRGYAARSMIESLFMM